MLFQSEDGDLEVKEESILVAQQGEQEAATATIMAAVDHQQGISTVVYLPVLVKIPQLL